VRRLLKLHGAQQFCAPAFKFADFSLARVMLFIPDMEGGATMKMKGFGLLGMVVGLMMLALPVQALAHGHDGDGRGHHDRGHHYGWYKHHGHDGDWNGRRGGWDRHHDRDDYDRGDYYGSNGGRWNTYGRGYQGPVPPIPVPLSGAYPHQGSYGSVNAPKLMQLRQTMTQRLNANQALYQAAMSRGNYQLANTARTRMQNQQATVNQIDSELNGAAAPAYGGYGANPYYGQTGYSPLSAITSMLGY
jgi:hypothetical protein